MVAFALMAALLSGCDSDASILDPAGPAADRIFNLFWILHVPAIIVFIVVMALLVLAIMRGRRAKDDDLVRDKPSWTGPFIMTSGVIVPTIVLMGAFLISLNDMSALSAPPRPAVMTIQVEANDWWWKVTYPEADAVTANEIHIPVGEPVMIELTTDDVLHSFWVPRLQVKMDTVNGTTNELWLQADEPGRYRGQCAEFCGLQHANMLFYVVAEERADFDRWLDNESQVADPGAQVAEGAEIFMASTCVGCHQIRGTTADGQVGPDLTHLASRETIAAGILPNTRQNLADFITRPHELKPGVTMPPTNYPPEQLEALLDYLESLD